MRISENIDYVGFAADVVSAYVNNNSIPAADLPALIQAVHAALGAVGNGKAEEPVVELKPAVAVKKSVTPDFIVCLEDGKPFKSLKRHLTSKYGLTPQDYHAKWGLPSDYPMVAPNYAAARSELAKKAGLGQQRSKAAAASKAASAEPAKRGSKPAAKAA